MKVEIKGLFPTPVYKSTVERKLTNKELKYIDSLDMIHNEFNLTSDNTYILESHFLKNFKKNIQEHIKEYFNKVICPADNITPYITQSWLNITNKGSKHHKHRHPNSIVSGVFYLSKDTLWFSKEIDTSIQIDKKTFHVFNSDTFFEPVEENQILLFPSNLTHFVKQYKETKPRKSIAFNIFVKGLLGSKTRTTELKI